MTDTHTRTVERPADDYDAAAWAAWWAANPHLRRAVGAGAADGDGGDGEGGDGGDGDQDGGDDAAADAAAAAEAAAAADAAAGNKGDKAGRWYGEIGNEDARALAGRFNGAGELAEYALSQSRKAKDALVIPAEDAPDEEKAAFWSRIGVPETWEDYEVERNEELPERFRPADDDPGLSGFLEMAHNAKFTPAQVKQAVQWYDESLIRADEAERAAEETARADAVKALKAEWKDDYEPNMKLVKPAVMEYGGEELIELFEAKGIADHPLVIRAYARIGRQLAEDGLLRSGVDEDSAKSLQEQIDDLQKKRSEAESKGDTDGAQKLYNDQQELYRKLYGSAPADGRLSRVA